MRMRAYKQVCSQQISSQPLCTPTAICTAIFFLHDVRQKGYRRRSPARCATQTHRRCAPKNSFSIIGKAHLTSRFPLSATFSSSTSHTCHYIAPIQEKTPTFQTQTFQALKPGDRLGGIVTSIQRFPDTTEAPECPRIIQHLSQTSSARSTAS